MEGDIELLNNLTKGEHVHRKQDGTYDGTPQERLAEEEEKIPKFTAKLVLLR